ncbi:MAG: ABC transporter ATP-binding protein/permease [Pirellulales bacterium]|nr:ABC transporter ATP-binding protein/permease [Pirellulales bacterium]
MKNFGRTLRLALRYRVTVIACLASGTLVAILWGGNLTAVYPVVDVIMTDRALPEWMDDQLAKHEQEVVQYEQQLAELREQKATTKNDAKTEKHLQTQINHEEFKLLIHQKQVEWYRWAGSWAHRYLPDTPFATLMIVCGLVLIGTLLKCLFRVVNMVLAARLGYLVGFDVRKEFYRKILRLDMKSFNEQGRGDLMNRCTSDLNQMSSGVRTVVGQGLLEPLKMIVCLTIAAFVSWQLLLLTMIIAPIAGLTIRWLTKALKRAHRRAMQELSMIYETLTETLGGIKLIKAFTMESAERSRFHQSAKIYYQRQMKITRYHSLISPLTEFLGILMVLLASTIGGYLVLNRETHILGLKISDIPLTHGWMSVFFAMMAGMANPARKLSSLFGNLQQSFAAADRVYEVLDREPGITDPVNPVELPRRWKNLRLEQINFHYSEDKPVLADINLEIHAGETVAIVGPNGCGKSTLLNLIPRFYDVQQGRVAIDGIDLCDVRIRDLRTQIGLVSQETLLFNDTVSANIAYGTVDIGDDAIESAARKAHAHEFITEKLSCGYQTIVGPSGNKLSGGQRQRIALARAILRDPAILMLDEATSQIDLESEQLIHQVLQDFLCDRTALVVTHRMSTIALADRVVVMEGGRILDVGSHEELIGRCELYRRLASIGYRATA